MSVENRRRLLKEIKRYGWTMSLREEYLADMREDYPYEVLSPFDNRIDPPLVDAATSHLGHMGCVPFKEKNLRHYFFKNERAATWFKDFLASGGTRGQLKTIVHPILYSAGPRKFGDKT